MLIVLTGSIFVLILVFLLFIGVYIITPEHFKIHVVLLKWISFTVEISSPRSRARR